MAPVPEIPAFCRSETDFRPAIRSLPRVLPRSSSFPLRSPLVLPNRNAYNVLSSGAMRGESQLYAAAKSAAKARLHWIWPEGTGSAFVTGLWKARMARAVPPAALECGSGRAET